MQEWIDERVHPPSTASLFGKISSGRGECCITQIRKRNKALWLIGMTDMNPLGARAEHTQIAARIDDAGRNAMPVQDGNGEVHGVALGNASQINPERSMETHPASGKEPDIAP